MTRTRYIHFSIKIGFDWDFDKLWPGSALGATRTIFKTLFDNRSEFKRITFNRLD